MKLSKVCIDVLMVMNGSYKNPYGRRAWCVDDLLNDIEDDAKPKLGLTLLRLVEDGYLSRLEGEDCEVLYLLTDKGLLDDVTKVPAVWLRDLLEKENISFNDISKSVWYFIRGSGSTGLSIFEITGNLNRLGILDGVHNGVHLVHGILNYFLNLGLLSAEVMVEENYIGNGESLINPRDIRYSLVSR